MASEGLVLLFNEIRKRLVETGTRNRLVHVNRANARGNHVNIANEHSDEVYHILSAGKTMRFRALGKDGAEEAGDIRFTSDDGADVSEDRLTDNLLETRMGPDALQKRLLKIYREAKTAEEESGANILYLALGFMTWFEDKSSAMPREAPLILLPVELVRNARTSTYDLRFREDEFVTNLPLQQRLKEDFGINLPEVEIRDDWKPSDYFSDVEQIVAQHDRWKVDRDGIQLGFFSFSKLLMFRDLAIEAWPDGALADHALTKGLLYEGFESEPPLFGPEDRLDELLPPQKLFHVVDADASQAKVIEEVRSGRNLVVQGPPGTGKSQTITNIIAAATREGKRVLFVAEKMAALSVVHDRLVKVGLRDICLELHSRNSNKKTVLSEISRTITTAHNGASASGDDQSLRQVRDKLNGLAEVLHRPFGSTGETPFSLLGLQARYMGQDFPPPKLKAASLVSMSREDEQVLVGIIGRYAVLSRAEAIDGGHPFEGVRNLDLQPVELSRLSSLLERGIEAADALSHAIVKARDALKVEVPKAIASVQSLTDVLSKIEGLPDQSVEIARSMLACSDLPRLKDTISAGAAWRLSFDASSSTFVDAAFAQSAGHLRPPLVAGTQSFFARWGGAYRSASRDLGALLREPLPKDATSRLGHVDTLCDLEARRSDWHEDRDFCARALGDAWRGDKTDFQKLAGIAEWCTELQGAALKCPVDALLLLAEDADHLREIMKALTDTKEPASQSSQEIVQALDFDLAVFGHETLVATDLDALSQRFGEMLAGKDRYAAWVQLVRLKGQLQLAGLDELIQGLRDGSLNSQSAITELRFARAECQWQEVLARWPELKSVASENRHDLVSTFADLDRQKLKDNVSQILSAHLGQVPQGATGKMGIIRGEIGKKRGHIALRRLFEKAGEAIQRVKPVLLMSPISIAQFLPPGCLKFDLLLIDEASQVRPEDALGAIARAEQIVVVGDKKQLPPTSFFDRLLDDDQDYEDQEDGEGDLLAGAASVASMESILTLCEARGLGSRMLNWHYRSRDPSLIEVSNREFYDNKLILPPSPLQRDRAYGLCFTPVDGIYDRGGKRDNRKEGEAVVDRVAQHARQHKTLSLGIVTFSFAQRNLITELLEFRRRTDTVLDAFLREGQSEDVFVKNIENVQGDERDVILVSVGYGPSTPGGRPGMSFGPVNSDGGERRLNVLFTRARIRCEIFASFDPGDMDVSRAAQPGPRILKRFLEFAKHGVINESIPTGEDADSPFEEDVADVIKSLGYLADPQVGAVGFRIDIGVRHPDKPGTYLLAVECDGATYHSALWARERDRLRQDVLEHLGWRFHRIWSTDWFYNRKVEVDRLRKVLEAAREAAEHGVRIEGVNKAIDAHHVTEVEPATFELPEATVRQMPPYIRAVFPVRASHEPHEAPLPVLAELVWKIVEAEGPIHIDEAARRVSASYGKEKAGARIIKATRRALLLAQNKYSDLTSEDNFWFTRDQSISPPVRDRSAESGATLKATAISKLEIREALRLAREDNAGGDDAELIRSAARMMGFKRVGSDLHAQIAAVKVA
jgi:hypothetical protein